ncbi:type I-E CRISPR-associated protein Cse2/CasB [Neoactinobaculum massilliense]|uniref:type I-E CRISPR-associated protein Cse2/CasB n=1 Tax=Neoactinobaculum massilliense TaxID=2364794 RepID=UPI000F538F97|nr:type I-E CRISPR-associated protein Cse2/CasB [Neoactinobaculum massilliense]
MTEREKTAEAWGPLLATILAQRNEPEFRRERAALRKGITPATETWAYPYVLPVLSLGASAATRTALLRSLAMAAEYLSVPQRPNDGRRASVGIWACRVELERSGKTGFDLLQDPGLIGTRLATIHTLTVEEAAATLRRIFDLAVQLGEPPAVDYFDLTRTLLQWGNGTSAASREVRTRILRDFYSGSLKDGAAGDVGQEPSEPTDGER